MKCWGKKAWDWKGYWSHFCCEQYRMKKKRNHHLWNALNSVIHVVCTLRIVYDDDEDN